MDQMIKQKMTFDIRSERVDHTLSVSFCKNAKIDLDTNLSGNLNAFNPAELLLAALSACMIKGIERVVPILKFELSGVEVRVHGVRQDVPPRMESIVYQIIIDTNEADHRLELLHENVKKYGTVFNTIAPGTDMHGTIIRAGKP